LSVWLGLMVRVQLAVKLVDADIANGGQLSCHDLLKLARRTTAEETHDVVGVLEN